MYRAPPKHKVSVNHRYEEIELSRPSRKSSQIIIGIPDVDHDDGYGNEYTEHGFGISLSPDQAMQLASKLQELAWQALRDQQLREEAISGMNAELVELLGLGEDK